MPFKIEYLFVGIDIGNYPNENSVINTNVLLWVNVPYSLNGALPQMKCSIMHLLNARTSLDRNRSTFM